MQEICLDGVTTSIKLAVPPAHHCIPERILALCPETPRDCGQQPCIGQRRYASQGKRPASPTRRSSAPQRLFSQEAGILRRVDRFTWEHAVAIARERGSLTRRVDQQLQAIGVASMNYRQGSNIVATFGFTEKTTGLPRKRIAQTIPKVEATGLAIRVVEGTPHTSGEKTQSTRFDLTCAEADYAEARHRKNVADKRMRRERRDAARVVYKSLPSPGGTNERDFRDEHDDERSKALQTNHEMTPRTSQHPHSGKLEEHGDAPQGVTSEVACPVESAMSAADLMRPLREGEEWHEDYEARQQAASDAYWTRVKRAVIKPQVADISSVMA